MLETLRARARDARGFTLIELLVVVLVIGVLAAIAIPTFLGQSLKAKDASAKSNVKRLSGMIEECKVQSQSASYAMCNSDAELGNTPGLDWGGQPGNVGMFAAGGQTYIAYGVSDSKTGAASHMFYIVKDNNGIAHRICTPASAGGCPAGNYW